jgi:PKHD-type hydroxylase
MSLQLQENKEPAKFWCFKSALPLKFCDDVIELGLSKQEVLARTGGYGDQELTKDQLRSLKNIRNCNIAWLNENWIYKELHPFVKIANQNAGWQYNWNFSESCQFTKYKLNQYYDWHSDNWKAPYNDPTHPCHGKIRKLSMTCQLTDGSEYEGGELEFDFRDYDPALRDESKHVVQAEEILPKGSIIIFPSNTWHRVKPVTSGTRYSLVVWHLGEPFK